MNRAVIPDHPDPTFEEAAEVVDARQRARRVAASDLPIVIDGEPGTGRRTLAAGIVRQRSAQSERPIVVADGVEGVPDDLRAQFRGEKPGQVELLVLNFEYLSPRGLIELAGYLRAGLARLVAVATYRQAEEGAPEASDRGLTHASNLEMETGLTRFTLPPLRERRDDVVRWAQFFVQRAAERLSVTVPGLGARTLNAARAYRWPGNLIELDASLNRALCLSATHELQPADLDLPDEEHRIRPLAEAVDDFRRTYVERALAHFSGNRTQTARALGVDPRTIFRFLEKRQGGAG